MHLIFKKKQIGVKGSVAVKVLAVMTSPRGDHNLRIVDKCMTEKAANELHTLLAAGAAATGGTLT
jgi:hypothetical protein